MSKETKQTTRIRESLKHGDEYYKYLKNKTNQSFTKRRKHKK